MASTIAAITTGTGGVITTADNSGNLNLVSGTTTIVALTSAGIAVTGTLSATGITGKATGGEGGQISLNNTTDTASAYNFDVDSSNHGRLFTTQNNTNLSLGTLAGTGGTILLYTAATERMRIDSSGNLLVNSTTSPSGSGNAFLNGVVYVGSTNTDPTFNRVNGLMISATGTINTRATTTWDLGRDVTSGSHINFYTDNGAARVAAGSISSNGGTTSYNTTSDYRMKKNIAPMAGALTIIQALKPITFDWKDEFVGTKKSSQGFIAHELAEVFPDCVTGEKDAVDAKGNPQYQGIDTSFLVATLTAAIQELKAIIDTQAAQITALNAKVGI